MVSEMRHGLSSLIVISAIIDISLTNILQGPGRIRTLTRVCLSCHQAPDPVLDSAIENIIMMMMMMMRGICSSFDQVDTGLRTGGRRSRRRHEGIVLEGPSNQSHLTSLRLVHEDKVRTRHPPIPFILAFL